MKNRISLIFITMIFGFIFLEYKLFYLQVKSHDDLLQRASSQRYVSVPVNNLRGKIYDRNLIPLTDTDEKNYLVVLPQFVKNINQTADIISKYSDINYSNVANNLKQGKPAQYEVNFSEAQDIKSRLKEEVLITRTSSRYGPSSIAKHIIGYVSKDNRGQAGIEKALDPYLQRDGHQFVGVFSDVYKKPIPGYGLRAVETFSKNEKYNVKLTIDYHLQKIMEDAFDKYKYTGAAVLVDSQSGDILGMVSKPDFDPNNISKYLNSDRKELIDRAVYPYSPGSIFKTAVVEAALEEGVVKKNEIFFCPGYATVDGQIVKCSSFYEGGHGFINFTDAYAKSCNTTFIQIGLRLGRNKIMDAAKELGLGEKIGLDEFGIDENVGNIKNKIYVSNREVANISIGQGDILATPLQTANMINIIANDGIMKKLNLVEGIVNDDGDIVKNFKNSSSSRAIPEDNAKLIKRLMEEVTKSGTGKIAGLEGFGGAAGKTGSAETGIFKSDGSQVIHAWFGGYFPVENPKYVLVVVVEDGKASNITATPLFADIAQSIVELGSH